MMSRDVVETHHRFSERQLAEVRCVSGFSNGGKLRSRCDCLAAERSVGNPRRTIEPTLRHRAQHLVCEADSGRNPSDDARGQGIDGCDIAAWDKTPPSSH